VGQEARRRFLERFSIRLAVEDCPFYFNSCVNKLLRRFICKALEKLNTNEMKGHALIARFISMKRVYSVWEGETPHVTSFALSWHARTRWVAAEDSQIPKVLLL
jgi:hypothetical protein